MTLSATREDPDEVWWLRAACRDHPNPDLWFPDTSRGGKEALRVCRGCTVQQQCGEDALSRLEPYGIWAGKRQRQRPGGRRK